MITIRRALVLGSGLLLAALLLALWGDSRRPHSTPLVPTLTGEAEYCTTCHADLPEISPSHPVKAFGCVICHGGERLALDADLAHSTLRGGANPSDLAVVEQSCGGSNCHSRGTDNMEDYIHRAQTSIQSTYAGAIANILYMFGAEPDLTARFGIHAVTDDLITTSTGVPSLEEFDPAQFANPSIQAFSDNCLTCHISAEPRPGDQFARLTGCAACHTPDINSFPDGQIHQLTTAIPYTQCNTCHNRGNYDLRSMTLIERTDQPTDRLHDYYQPIAQFTQCEWTLDCVDCHTRAEVMGDGDIHANQADIQYIQCKTCHGTLTELPQTYTIASEDDHVFEMARLNPVVSLQVGDVLLATEQGEPLWNTRVLPDGTYELIGKATQERFTFRPVMGTQCQQNPEEQDSRYCHECHSVDH